MDEPLLYKIIKPVVTFLFKVIYKPEIIGIENIPKNGSIIFAGNHTNYLDCLLLISSTKRCIHFLAKDSLYKGIKKPIFKGMGIIPINRKTKNKEAILKAENILLNNGVIGIFPEGTINRTKEIIMPFKIGAVKMASDTKSKIIPFTIAGKYKPFNRNIRIEFYKSINVDSKDLEFENKKLMKIIEDNLKEYKYGKN